MLVGFNAQADTYSVLSANINAQSSVINELSVSIDKQQPPLNINKSERSPLSSSPTRSYQYALPEPVRYANAGGLILSEPEPDYQVEIELSIPLSASFVIGYAVNATHNLHWLMHTCFSKSRISGWKDSNLLYSHRQYPDLITFA